MGERPPRRLVERATVADLIAVTGEWQAFWGERDMTFLHPLMLVHEFGEMALVVRDGQGGVTAYLCGVLTLAGAGYIHVVAVREGYPPSMTMRRAGLARLLYREFESVARAHGASSLKAITQPVNTASIAFHRALGFTVTEVADYSGPGQPRMVFTRALGGRG